MLTTGDALVGEKGSNVVAVGMKISHQDEIME